MLNSVTAELKIAGEELAIANSRIQACRRSCNTIQDGIFKYLGETEQIGHTR